jgi:hypothetical protein
MVSIPWLRIKYKPLDSKIYYESVNISAFTGGCFQNKRKGPSLGGVFLNPIHVLINITNACTLNHALIYLLTGNAADDGNDHQYGGKAGQKKVKTHNRSSFL